MNKKIKVLRIISTLNPHHGGPAKAIIDNSLAMIKQNISIDILTCDSYSSNFYKSKYMKIINQGPSFLGNFWFSFNLFFWLFKNKSKYDFFILHGIWEFKNLVAYILLDNNYCVYVHGSLHPTQGKGLLNKFKKKLYWLLFEKRNLLKSTSIILTSHKEKEQLKNTFVNTNGINKTNIRYGILKKKHNKKELISKFYKRFPFLKNKTFYLYLGRPHKQKGADIIIEAVNKIKFNFKSKVLIMGPFTGSKFEDYLKLLVKKYRLEKQIFFSGAEFGDLKWGAIYSSKAMLLPSHGENFGISLVESMSAGKPVLTTYKVNIYDDILKYESGLISKDNINSFSDILLKFNSFNNNKKEKISNNALQCFEDNFDISSNSNSLASYIKKEISK